ncbi:unnamed protein product [Brachionus calyciflorus]|uniref:Reverse transcriptase RNase H-like domain-containing protein n=1 Tax=Brachionus calyciflorus TaxID=104777 RepID=A0A814GUT8_9BILA|nr:unnamed protein product [Brachionus calyciflorus]
MPETRAHAYLHTFVGRYQELNESLVQFAAVLIDSRIRAFPDLTSSELDAYILGQFMTGLRNRDIADKLMMMDIGDMETLVLRAREQESLFLGFSGFGMWNRSQNQISNRRAMTNEEIRNLITSKFEPYYQQGRTQQQPQMNNTIENLRRHENSFMPMQMSEISKYSRVLDQPNDGIKGHIRRNCPNQSRNVQNDYYRLNFDPNSPVNSSTPVNRNASFYNRANTNNVNDEVEEQEHNYVYEFIGHIGSFTTANGQPLEVMGKVKTKLNEVELNVIEMPTKNSKKQSLNTVEFTDEEQKVMQEFFDQNEEMFASSMKDLCCCNYTVHSIDTQGSEPKREPPRRVPIHMKEEIKKQLDELLEAGIIEPSNSEWATSLVPIKKKTGGIRLCIDYRNFHKLGYGKSLLSGENGPKRQIKAYWSRKMIKSERNYSETEKEALAIVEAMEHFRVYLYGSDVLVCTDHHPLKWMMNVKDPKLQRNTIVKKFDSSCIVQDSFDDVSIMESSLFEIEESIRIDELTVYKSVIFLS